MAPHFLTRLLISSLDIHNLQSFHVFVITNSSPFSWRESSTTGLSGRLGEQGSHDWLRGLVRIPPLPLTQLMLKHITGTALTARPYVKRPNSCPYLDFRLSS